MTTQSPSTELFAPASAQPQQSESETDSALFVIWGNGRHAADRILADLQDRFTLLKLYEVSWSSGRVMENYRRFYSDLPVRGVYHSHAKGRAPFLAAVVLDRSPHVMERMTSRGPRTLNARFLDAKLEYRRWAGELTIHSTETPFETERDLTMLFGVDPGRMERLVGGGETSGPGAVERVHRDLTGSAGWASEAELFAVLNRAVDYVVTGAPGLPGGAEVLRSPHVNLLTNDYLTLHAALNARPRLPWPDGGPFRVRIGGEWVEVRIRFVGDGFYPPGWAQHLLESGRQRAEGARRLSARDDFEALAYDLVVHRRRVDPTERRRLTDLAARLRIDGWPVDPIAPRESIAPLLRRWMRQHHAAPVRPLDPLVDFDPGMAPAPGKGLGKGGEDVRRRTSGWEYRAGHALRGWVGAARDQILYRMPAIRRIRRMKPREVAGALRRGMGARGVFALKRAVLLVRGVLYLGRRYKCPCCGWSLRAFTGEWSLSSSNGDGYCPRCNAKARHRRLWLYLQEHTDLLEGEEGRVLEIAPWWAISRRLQQLPHLSFVGIDLGRRGPHVTLLGDAAALPLEEDCIDSALCIHTLEHIERDLDAMRELHRVLKPGGWAIVSVPLRPEGPTYEDPSVTDPEDRAREFGERSHVRFYGRDIEERLKNAGFSVHLDEPDRIAEDTRRRFGLRADETLFICGKSPAGT
jgi:SAM-dependent methyltransferase